MNIRKRYSEFDDFRARLIQTFPNFEAAVPVLPPKSVISKFRPRFLEKRRAGLQYFLKYVAAMGRCLAGDVCHVVNEMLLTMSTAVAFC